MPEPTRTPAGSPRTANVAVFLFLSGSQAMIPFVPLYARSLGAHPAAIGLILGGYHVLPQLVAIPLGGIIQRWGAGRSMLAACLCGAAGALVMLGGGLPYLVFGLLVFGVASLTVVSSGQVETLLNVPAEAWDRAIGMFAFSTSLALIVGPLAGATLVRLGGYALIFPGTAVLVLAAGASILRLAQRPRGEALLSRPPSRRATLSALGQPAVALVLLCSMTSESALSFWSGFFPLLLAGKGFTPEVIALYFSLRGVATASIRPLLGVFTRLASRARVLIVSLALMALALALMPVLTRPTEYAAVVILFGIAAGFIFPLTLALVSVGFSPEAMGTGVGIRQFVTRVGQLLGPVLLGLVTQATGLTAAFVTSAVIVGGTAAVYARFRARGG